MATGWFTCPCHDKSWWCHCSGNIRKPVAEIRSKGAELKACSVSGSRRVSTQLRVVLSPHRPFPAKTCTHTTPLPPSRFSLPHPLFSQIRTYSPPPPPPHPLPCSKHVCTQPPPPPPRFSHTLPASSPNLHLLPNTHTHTHIVSSLPRPLPKHVCTHRVSKAPLHPTPLPATTTDICQGIYWLAE